MRSKRLENIQARVEALEPERLIIAGIPNAGKTTLSKNLAKDSVNLREADDLLPMDWSEASRQVALWFNEPGPWIYEGVVMARALRKWMRTHQGQPADVIVHLTVPLIPLTDEQETMAKGCLKVWEDIAARLKRRGVTLIEA